MKLITYHGDPANGGEGPPFVHLWDITFPKGEAVEVEDAFAIAKASANSHFKVRGKPGRRRGKDSE